jgi:SMC interacting uncharacterized protein involved in chromosome segregation
VCTHTYYHIGSQDELTALEQECAALSVRASGLEKELAQERLQEDALREKMALNEANCQRLREMIKEETDISHALRQEKELLLQQHQKDLEESLQKAESLRQRAAEAESTCQKLREAKILKSPIKVTFYGRCTGALTCQNFS